MTARRPLGRAFVAALLALLFFVPAPAQRADRQRIQVDDYLIDAEINPKTHRLTARARVRFTTLEDIAVATFDLHNGLAVKRVTDDSGRTLAAERVTQDSTVRISLPAGMTKGTTSALTFEYEGTLISGDDSPVPGLKLAYVGDDSAYLLYSGRWFPVAGYGTNRFTSTINVSVPANWVAIGSGRETLGNPARAQLTPAADQPVEDQAPALTRDKKSRASRRTAKQQRKPAPPRPTVAPAFDFTQGNKVYTFTWDRPSFPGTIIAGAYEEQKMPAGGLDLRVYFKPGKKQFAAAYAEAAEKQFTFFTSLYGQPMSTQLNVVELPDDTVPSAWAPEIAALASRAINEKTNYRLLANTIAHQWWGVSVSPATRDDWWLTDGFARYSEARYVESVAGQAGYEEALKDMQVGALAYDAVPLSRVSTLDTFSPEFQSLVTDKGAVILHMLRWVQADPVFDKTLRQFYQQSAGKSSRVEAFQQVASQVSGQNLTWFFSQWLDSTGAPEFRNKYTVFRTGKGFRIVGEIAQDLDLFRMPVELRIDTDGKTETKRIEVVGTNSPYAVETFGKPRRISIDPGGRVLQNSPDLKLRTGIMRGQQLVQQGDLTGALKEYQKSLEANRNSSLAHYRIAEVFFLQRNYQAAANAYREAINGDLEPRWTEVWSRIQLGKIFDITGQRERAVNEYRQALQTNDNTQGALEEARRYLQKPYERERNADRAGD